MNNQELDLAWQFVNHTNRNIFLTGKAGTGKTTFLHRLKNESMKRLVVVAPTGVAAINAKGVTIHSFFQMPFGINIPGENQEIKREYKRKFSRKKIDIIRSLDLLIIDEVSMVRADLLDAIDQVLRKYKDRNRVFGGVQVLMIGDLQQLSPVVKQNEWEILKKYYETPYFFSSKAFQQANPVNIELKHIYRQQDEEFIDILNQVRDNKLTPESIKTLNERFIPGFNPPDNEAYVLLTTHNYKADKINQRKLEELPHKTYFFHAYIEGNFSENAYPNDERLALKKDAQVMFIKNDSSMDKRYYNGKIGRITRINDTSIYVVCQGETEEIEVGRERWDNITYEIDDQTNVIEEKVKGSFSQIPLRLAWAITIHKSQGLTFDKAVIDAELSFAHGQTYVALSRCKTLEGLVLKSPINTKSIINDQRVSGFTQQAAQNQPDEKVLKESEKQFFISSLSELLNFYNFLYPTNRMLDIYLKNKSSFKGNIAEPLQHIKDKGLVPLLKIKDSFIKQIQSNARDKDDLEKDAYIQERIQKALQYYSTEIENHIKKPFQEISYDTDNKQLLKDFEKHLQKFDELLQVKLHLFNHTDTPFNIKNYLKTRADAVLQDRPKKKKKKTYNKLVEHIDLFEALRDLRSEFAYNEDVHHFQVFTQETLYELCDKLPATTAQLKKISGIGKVRLKKYGSAILDLIQSYCIANNIEMKNDEPEIIKAPKGQTKEISLQLFKEGKNLDEIAAERQLTRNTIMGHLAYFIPTGEVQITDLITEEKYKNIQKIIAENEFESLSELKQITGDEYDWGELRLVLNLKNQENEKD